MKTFLVVALALIVSACAGPQVVSQADKPVSTAGKPSYSVVLPSDVKWEQLNPARGDQSPQAGTLWGDRKGAGPSGYLLKPVDGFRSPPHIHNVSYRGMVISGRIHNADANAVEMWMPTGSFWTQPKGAAHITAARGSNTLAYIEIEEGPYLVHPAAQAFQSEGRPINVHVSNVVWVEVASIVRSEPGLSASAKGPRVAFLWGNPQDERPSGTLVKLPAGFAGALRSHGSTFRAVVIRGRLEHRVRRSRVPGETDVKTMVPGSYFGSTGESVHQVSSDAGEACIIYVRAEGKFDVHGAQPKK